MAALAVKPLICQLKQDVPEVKQVWYADDATGAGSCSKLRLFWDHLSDLGKVYGYYPNSSKTHLIVKVQFLQKANEVFAGTGINVTTNGQRHLGAAISKRSSVEEYVKMKVSQWTTEVRQLADIAKMQPQAAYSAYVHGLSSRWIFLSRTIPNISHLLEPVEVALQQDFIPALTTSSSQQRKSSGQWLYGHSFRDSSNGGTGGLKQLEKKSFSILALAELVDADTSFNIRVGMVDFCLLRHLIAFQNCFLLVELKVLK